MKKIIAMLLVLCMLLTALPVFASETVKQEFTTESFAGEIIVPHDKAEKVGEWKTSSVVPGYDGGAHVWAGSSNGAAYAIYTPEGLTKGNYEVYNWVPPHYSSAKVVWFDINHGGKVDTVTQYLQIDQDETQEPGWVSLGVFEFNGDGKETVKVYGNGGSIRTSALKFVPTKKEAFNKGIAPDAGKKPVMTESATPAPETTTTTPTTSVADDQTYDGEVIFHYKNAQLNGKWADSSSLKNYDGGPQAWNGTAKDTIVFSIAGVQEGNYEVFYYVVSHENNVAKTPFTIVHNGQTHESSVLTKPSAGGPATDGWVSMGVFDFKGAGDETITLNHPGKGNARGTAIKLVPTTKEVSVPAEEVKEETKEETVVSAEGVTVIGTKHPDSSSKLKDIEVLPAGKCSWEGDWRFSSAVLGPMVEYQNSMWIAGVGEEAYVTYNPRIEAVGDVNVFVYLLWWNVNQNPKVKYEVYHNGKVDTVMLDPTTLTESSWVYLGTFDFAGDMNNEYVKLVCQQDENAKGNTRASTIMFEIVNSEGGIWQTKYVTPFENMDTKIESGEMAALNKFTDMKGHWANYDVEYMANEGLVSGVADDLFDPEANITRAEYVTILDRAMGYDLVTGESYADVAQDAWYAPYVATAKANGLLNGLPTDDGFKPEQPITREEMGLFTYNAIKATKKNDEWVKNMPDGWANFTDTDSVSDWAKEGLKYLIQTGIIKGTSDTTVSPMENATRAQGAVILKRFMQKFVWAGPPADQEWVMTFSDEFNGTEMDWGVWRSDSSSPGHIQSSRWPENVEVHDGAVHLVIRHEEKGGKEWTAGSVWVRPEVFAQAYGYWEASYKIAASTGINNSFWTYTSTGYNIHRVKGTGKHFELDINEGHYPNSINMTYHTDVTGEKKAHSSTYLSPYDLSADYHTYALEWTPEELRFYHDGVLRSTQPNLNADQLQFPYLSSAVLNWAGKATDRTDGTAQIVDYVRIWQKKEYMDDPKLNYKGEPMVGVGPAEQGKGTAAPTPSTSATDSKPEAPAEIVTTTKSFDGEILIPYADAEKTGEWKTSSAVKGYDGNAHYWAGKDGFIKYYAKDLTKGKYEVYYWLCPHPVCTEIITLDVCAGGETKKVALRQQLKEGEEVAPGWASLGTYEFNGDGSEYVHLGGISGSVRTSAVKFVPVK